MFSGVSGAKPAVLRTVAQQAWALIPIAVMGRALAVGATMGAIWLSLVAPLLLDGRGENSKAYFDTLYCTPSEPHPL